MTPKMFDEDPPMSKESINHPAHYNKHPSGIECIDIVEHMTFNCGNAMKYLWRAGLKDSTKNVEDLKKAAWYIDREIQRLLDEEQVTNEHATKAQEQPEKALGI